jgi:hypothetical protein
MVTYAEPSCNTTAMETERRGHEMAKKVKW